MLRISLIITILFTVSACGAESDSDYLAKFKEGSVDATTRPQTGGGSYNWPFKTFSDTTEAQRVTGINQWARVLAVFENKPEDFQYAEQIPYTLVVGWGRLSSNNAIRNLNFEKNGRTITWTNQAREDDRSDPCFAELKINDDDLANNIAILNVLDDAHQDKKSFVKKVGTLKPGDVIRQYGVVVNIKHTGDSDENALKSQTFSHSAPLLGPQNPLIIDFTNLEIKSSIYRASNKTERCKP
ncbi:MAG: hypothetical protein HKN53_07725 [Maribacter sp.]|nr:hypothetical protein [Maribacter sp.]